MLKYTHISILTFLHFTTTVAKNDEELLMTCCEIFDLDDTKTVGYGVLLHIFRLIMDGISFFGDKILEQNQIVDVVNSVFTLEGKTEGFIYFENFIETIIGHHVVVLLKSQQYQGLPRAKFQAMMSHAKAMRTAPDNTWRGVSLSKSLNDDDDDDGD